MKAMVGKYSTIIVAFGVMWQQISWAQGDLLRARAWGERIGYSIGSALFVDIPGMAGQKAIDVEVLEDIVEIAARHAEKKLGLPAGSIEAKIFGSLKYYYPNKRLIPLTKINDIDIVHIQKRGAFIKGRLLFGQKLFEQIRLQYLKQDDIEVRCESLGDIIIYRIYRYGNCHLRLDIFYSKSWQRIVGGILKNLQGILDRLKTIIDEREIETGDEEKTLKDLIQVVYYLGSENEYREILDESRTMPPYGLIIKLRDRIDELWNLAHSPNYRLLKGLIVGRIRRRFKELSPSVLALPLAMPVLIEPPPPAAATAALASI